MKSRRQFRLWVMAGLLAVLAPLAVNGPARAEDAVPANEVSAEYLYTADDAYLDRRVQAVTDTKDVLLAMEWLPTVDGTVDGARICLDLDPAEVNTRLPLFAYLWSADGQLLAFGGAYEGISGSAPCFYDVGFTSVPVTADQHYVMGFWIKGGQYSYVPYGFRSNITNATGHIVGLSAANSTVGAGNGLYAYTSLLGSLTPFPTASWHQTDYLVSPRFTPTTTTTTTTPAT
jgi:Domain of unknown function (DUF4082)